jgi:hypothetical protein
MDSDKVFKKYLGTWPDAWIMWPKKGQDKVKDFFWSNPEDPFVGKAVFDDFLDYVKEEWDKKESVALDPEQNDPGLLSCSEWLQRYFQTVRGREHAKKYLARHEPMLAMTSFNVKPLKDLMDGFIKYFIENREVLYGNKL